jgi:hypothetical protein
MFGRPPRLFLSGTAVTPIPQAAATSTLSSGWFAHLGLVWIVGAWQLQMPARWERADHR